MTTMADHPENLGRKFLFGCIPVMSMDELAAEMELEARVDEHRGVGVYVRSLIETLALAVRISSGNMTLYGWPLLPKDNRAPAPAS